MDERSIREIKTWGRGDRSKGLAEVQMGPASGPLGGWVTGYGGDEDAGAEAWWQEGLLKEPVNPFE